MTYSVRHLLEEEAETVRLAQSFADIARPGDLITLSGDLGAGKSTFARAFIRSATTASELEVPSPTFTIVQSYDHDAGHPIYHADLYRLESETEIEDLGLDDEREVAIMLVEWPDRLPNDWRADAVDLSFSLPQQGRGRRELVVTTHSAAWQARLIEYAAHLGLHP